MKSDNGGAAGNSYEELGNRLNFENSSAQNCAAEKITNVEATSVIGDGDGTKNAIGLSCPTEETPQVPGVVAGTGTRKRTIVRKTVRVVKKLIKKRVPKRVLINGLGNRGELVKVEDGVNLSEVRNNGNLANDVIERSNLVDEVIEETGRVSEAKDTANIANDSTEVLNLENGADKVEETTSIVHCAEEKADIRGAVSHNLEIINAPNLSRPVNGEEVDDLSAQMESEMSKPDIHANFSEQMVPINNQSGLNPTEADDVKGNAAVCEVQKKDFERVSFTPGNTTETNERENTMTENQLTDRLMVDQRIDIARKADMELLAEQNVGSVEEESGVLGGRENGRSIAQAESCSGEVESNCIKLNEGLLYSGEMEALERKKKRKTEIFLGGLDKYTKEEDIREVFKDVGIVEEVRLVMNPKSGKNRGYAFVRFATSADAKNVLAKYSKVEVTTTRVLVTLMYLWINCWPYLPYDFAFYNDDMLDACSKLLYVWISFCGKIDDVISRALNYRAWLKLLRGT